MIFSDGRIYIQQWKDTQNAAGNYISIYPWGTLNVGEWYANAKGELESRWTVYKKDGTKIRDFDTGK